MMLDDEARRRAEILVRDILTGSVVTQDIAHDAQANDLETSERMGNALRMALENPDTNDFDTAVSVAAFMLRDGERLPDWLASFAADVLEGNRKRPTKRGPDPYANWIRDYSLARAVLEVSRQFGLPEYTNNELSGKITAAQIVAQTAHLSLEVVHHAIKRFGGDIKRITSPQVQKN